MTLPLGAPFLYLPHSIASSVDLPQVDCERASENEGRSLETRAKVARRVITSFPPDNQFSC